MYDNEDSEQLEKKILDILYPNLISNLLINDLIDTARLDDKEYIRKVISENLHLIDEMKIQVTEYHSFIEGMKSEIDQSRLKTAVVLGGTCIEHIMNHFYQDVLPLLFDLDQGEINKVIGSLKLPDKIGWFYKITTKVGLPKELVNKILEIISLRNKVVHFQAVPEIIDTNSGSYQKLNSVVQSFDVSSIITTIKELETELEKVVKDLWPEINIANDIFERFFS
ncbi:hypothetical protein MHB54_21375 [Paenibacillus sp. FSL M7-0802]|uniref:hypothetical protein n=2 Tax=Paenibacillus TaxID=44249 RepID=UPI0030D111D4